MTQRELDTLSTAISNTVALCHKEVLTMDEVAQYTGLSKNALYKLTSARLIPHYKPNGKNCFFRRKEVEDWLTANPVATVTDLNTQAQTYCMKKPLR